jgi:3-hydroxybutyrate dehydrogenase
MTPAQKTVLVTGSTSGIGLAMATAFARQGCNIVINGFGEKALIAQITADLKAAGAPDVLYSGADMRRAGEIREMVAAAEKKFGAVDVLINNAGIQFVSDINGLPEEKWDDIIAINLTAPFHATKAVLPGMQKRKWGRIINLASVQGLVGSINKSAYVASKHGIIGLTKVTALENATRGITCNAICPGFTLTPLVQKQLDARAAERNLSPEQAVESLLGEKQPMMKFIETEQLAALAVFLASDAAERMTGVALPMDGGWTAQ